SLLSQVHWTCSCAYAHRASCGPTLTLRAFVAFAGPPDLLMRLRAPRLLRPYAYAPGVRCFRRSTGPAHALTRTAPPPALRLRSGRSLLSQVHWTCSCAYAHRASPIIRSTSATISRRWKGLLR